VRNTDRPVRILLAGKAHPADRPAQELIQHLYMLSQEADLEGRVAFIENYNMRVGRMLVQGVDVWLNTPRRPLEASGTSGQKAAVNGVLNCSILDGWWPEGFDGENGWSIGSGETATEEWVQDQNDANSLYSILEEQVLPTYYERDPQGLPLHWIEMMKRSMATLGARFSASRMVREYTDRAYMPLARSGATIEQD
jgi:starch phosphorylase